MLEQFLFLMYNKLSNGDINYAVLILNYIICGISGFSIVLSNSFFGFAYLRDKLHLYLGILLPIVGYSITLIIGSNIALSLGMIGALSVIRFRTPVRSSYELVIYFLLLTIGITASVDSFITIILTLTSMIVLFILSLPIGINFSKFNKKNDDEKIILNFSMKSENQDIGNLISKYKAISVSVNKEQDYFILNGTIEFLMMKDIDEFIKQNENNITSYELYKN